MDHQIDEVIGHHAMAGPVMARSVFPASAGGDVGDDARMPRPSAVLIGLRPISTGKRLPSRG